MSGYVATIDYGDIIHLTINIQKVMDMQPEREFLGYIQKEVTLHRLDTPFAESERRRYAIYQLNLLLREFGADGNSQTLKEIETLQNRLASMSSASQLPLRKSLIGLPAPRISNPYTLEIMNEIGIVSNNTAMALNKPLTDAQRNRQRQPAAVRSTAQDHFNLKKYPLPTSEKKVFV